MMSMIKGLWLLIAAIWIGGAVLYALKRISQRTLILISVAASLVFGSGVIASLLHGM